MSEGYAAIAITSVLSSEKSFCKFLSANDTGATGAHQSGILISKTAMEMLFSKEQLGQKGIPKRIVKKNGKTILKRKAVLPIMQVKMNLG